MPIAVLRLKYKMADEITNIIIIAEDLRSYCNIFMLILLEHSFSEVNQKANQFADAMKKLGVTREQKMALLMDNKPEVFFTLYGTYQLSYFVQIS